jgi:hypothetical protein
MTTDVWTPYAQQGHGKGHSPVPEAGFYGALLIGTCLLAWVLRKIRR